MGAFVSPYELAGVPAGEKVIVALSGGADSTSLLSMMIERAIPVIAVHVNHGIRGEEAERDEEFCRRLCRKHGCELVVFHVDVPRIAKESGESLEGAARRVRYDLFEKIMRERSVRLLATAHNADDNAETVIFNLSRGAALGGGAGIPPVRKTAYSTIVRPILSLSRAEILAYCKEHSCDYVTDSTNLELCCSRNRIRHIVMPVLRELNPQASAAIARFGEFAREDNEFLDDVARNFISEHGGTVAQADFLALPSPVARRVLFFAAEDVGASLDAAHAKSIAEALRVGRGAVSLPPSFIAKIREGKLVFERDERRKKVPRQRPHYSLRASEGITPLPHKAGTVFTCDATVSDEFTEKSEKNDPKNTEINTFATSATLDADKIKGDLVWRNIMPGDEIRFRSHRRVLRKLISASRPPLTVNERALMPVLCDGDGVLYVPFVGVRDGCAANANTARVLRAGYLPPTKSDSPSAQ